MTITSRGAVAPTGDQAGSQCGRPPRHGCARLRRQRRRRPRLVVGQDRRRRTCRPPAAGDHRHHGGRGGLVGGGLRGQGTGPPHDRGGRGALRGHRDVRAHGAPVPRRRARDREGWQALLRRAGPRGARRTAAGAGLSGDRLRQDHVSPDHGRGLDAARRHQGVTRRRARPRPTPTPPPTPARRSCWPRATWPRSGPATRSRSSSSTARSS